MKKVPLSEYLKLEKDYQSLLSKQLKISYEMQELKQKIQEDASKKDERQKIHENIRKLKHDMRNHFMVIASYLNSNETNKAKKYISKILDKLNLDYSYVETGNTLLNYILSAKLAIAKEYGIHVKMQIETLFFKRMDSIDFAALLSNLIDNALEALRDAKKKEMSISILKKRAYDTIQIKNTIDSSVLAHNKTLSTTKPDKLSHGVGLSQVREIINRYEGMIEFYEEDGCFCVLAMIEEV